MTRLRILAALIPGHAKRGQAAADQLAHNAVDHTGDHERAQQWWREQVDRVTASAIHTGRAA